MPLQKALLTPPLDCAEKTTDPDMGTAEARRPPRWSMLDSYFFALGAASDVTFNGLVMSVAFLRQEIGPNVLQLIGQAQFLGSISAMTLLFGISLWRPQGAMTRGMVSSCVILIICALYMLLLNLAMLVVAAIGWQLDPACLFVAMLFNGFATGGSQSCGSLLAGVMTKLANHPTASTAHMSGVGFGIALPTVLQMTMTPIGVSPPRAGVVCYSIAASQMMFGVFSFRQLWTSRSFRTLRESQHLAKECWTENGQEAAFGEQGSVTNSEAATMLQRLTVVASRYRTYVRVRALQIGLPSTTLALNFASLVYGNMLTTHIKTNGNLLAAEELPTILLGMTNICDFLGRATALVLLQEESKLLPYRLFQRCLKQAPFMGLLLLLRFCGIAVAVFCSSAIKDTLAHSDGALIALYAGGAAVGGMLTVATTHLAQTRCMASSGPSMTEYSPIPCPISGQIMFLACIFGSLTGSMCPLVLP